MDISEFHNGNLNNAKKLFYGISSYEGKQLILSLNQLQTFADLEARKVENKV